MINEHIKSEFKRFFDYAFKFNIEYWKGFARWENFWGKTRTPNEEKLFNRLVNDVVRSDEGLKKIINDPQLEPAKELKYYAYLFLQDMGKADGITEPTLPVIPEQYIGIYDNPTKLINIIRDSGKPSDARLWALGRIKELSPWNSYPATIFDREIFTREKWANWMSRSSSIDGRGEYKSIDRIFYNAKMLELAKEAKSNSWDAFSLYAEGYMLATGEAPIVSLPKPTSPTKQACTPNPPQWPSNIKYGHPAGMRVWNAEVNRYNQEKAACDQAVTNYNNAKAAYDTALAEYNNVAKCSEYINPKWKKYRQEQDEEFPPLLAQYERDLAVEAFSDAGLIVADYVGSDYRTLQDKLGEARTKELWNNPEKLLQAVEGQFSGEWKNIFATRLYDTTILTLAEQKRVMTGLREIYENMFYGESFTVPLVNPDLVEVVDKNLLDQESPESKKDEL